jgi:hypothetical protein
MRRCAVVSLLVLGCALAGCNQPAVTLKPPAFQSSENSARDWNDVAHKIAAEMAWIGLVPAYSTEQARSDSSPSSRPICIRAQAIDSSFIRQVSDELEADICAGVA